MHTAASEPTIRQRVETAIGDETFETALYGAEQKSLSDSQIRSQQIDAVANLPDHPLGGWEELVVFTEKYVYQWVKTGYSSGPQRLPRHPDSISDGA